MEKFVSYEKLSKKAKKLVDALPAEIKKDVPADEAEKIKKSLTDAGATVEFK